MYNDMYEKLLPPPSNEPRTAMDAAMFERLSSARHKHASYFLTTRPTQKKYILNTEQFLIALRVRLGIPLHNAVAAGTCLMCNREMHADHLLTCNANHNASTVRHNIIEEEVKELAQEVGCYVQSQPRINQSPQGGKSNDRPDALIFPGDGRAMFVDYSLTTPSAASYNYRSRSAIATRTREKHAHYDEPVRVLSEVLGTPYTFVAFVLETYGEVGAEAEQLLAQLDALASIRSIVPSSSEPDFHVYSRRRMNFALQRAIASQLAVAGFKLSVAICNRARPVFDVPENKDPIPPSRKNALNFLETMFPSNSQQPTRTLSGLPTNAVNASPTAAAVPASATRESPMSSASSRPTRTAARVANATRSAAIASAPRDI